MRLLKEKFFFASEQSDNTPFGKKISIRLIKMNESN